MRSRPSRPRARADRAGHHRPPMSATAWDAESYDGHAKPQLTWARAVLRPARPRRRRGRARRRLRHGAVTPMILEGFPDGRVIGVDAAPEMIEKATEAIGSDPRVELGSANLLDLDLDQEVDVIFSNAIFHWILDHQRLFERLHAALRPGGQMETQCGGAGNISEIRARHRRARGRRALLRLPAPGAAAVELCERRRHGAAPRARGFDVRRGSGFEPGRSRLGTRAASSRP